MRAILAYLFLFVYPSNWAATSEKASISSKRAEQQCRVRLALRRSHDLEICEPRRAQQSALRMRCGGRQMWIHVNTDLQGKSYKETEKPLVDGKRYQLFWNKAKDQRKWDVKQMSRAAPHEGLVELEAWSRHLGVEVQFCYQSD